jgi:crossover junction endodeoxyribonuclease RuvC
MADRILGVDPSTKTGLIMLDQFKLETYSRVLTSDERGVHRLLSIEQQFRNTLDQWKPTLAVIEGYGYANKFTLTLMVEIGVLMRIQLHKHGIPWYIVPPTVLKKFSTGNGAAPKAAVAKAVEERWKWGSPSDDLVDAYVLARIGEELSVNGVTSKLKGIQSG